MPRPVRLLISCGEPSGDLYAGELVRQFRALVPEVQAFGLGGDQARSAGVALHAHVKDLAVVGLVEVLRHLRRLRGVFRGLLAEVDRERPDLAVLLDYPDFNLRLAAALHARGVPVVYYVSPQLWAWRRGRIRTVRRTVSRMLVIFPFEEALYREAGVPVRFVGHPLVDLVHPPADPAAFRVEHGLAPDRPLLALLPGSRPQEVAHNAPPLRDAVALLRQSRPALQFALAVAPSLDLRQVHDRFAGLGVVPVHGRTLEVLGSADAAVVASGTATVETALLGTPMAVVYRLSPLTYRLGKPLVRVRHYAMPNLVAGREVVKELIQNDFTGAAVAGEALRLLEDPGRRREMVGGLREVRERLGGTGASRKAAEELKVILEVNSEKA